MGRIEEDINLGTLATGTWLKQADLEKSYQCARIDLREALDRLSEKNLVRLESNSGYRVIEIDERRLSEILRVRAILEVAAAEEIRHTILTGDMELAGRSSLSYRNISICSLYRL